MTAAVTISYSLTDGIMLLGTSRGDGSNTILKELHGGWRWFPPREAWYVRGSRNKPPDILLINMTKIALEEAGFTVEVTGVTDAELSTQPALHVPQPHVQPKVTPLTVAQRATRTQPTRSQPANTEPTNGGLQVHVKPDGEIVLDLGTGDSQTAVNFIRTLLGKNPQPATQVREAPQREATQPVQPPTYLGPREAMIWNYLRVNDSGDGVPVEDIREDLNLRVKQAAGTLTRLKKKGFAEPTRFGRWRALHG